jgi:hypothetical protein
LLQKQNLARNRRNGFETERFHWTLLFIIGYSPDLLRFLAQEEGFVDGLWYYATMLHQMPKVNFFQQGVVK